MAIRFFFEEIRPLRTLKRNIVKEIIRQIMTDYSFKCGNINFIFTSDEYLIKLNRRYLNHDFYTDVITFPEYEGKKVHGDVFISYDRVCENAEKYHVTHMVELYRVMIHAALHLCGMEDTTPAKKKQMTMEEDRYVKIIIFALE